MLKPITHVFIFAISASAGRGLLVCKNLRFPCLLGKKGRAVRKLEGDLKTPSGRFSLLNVHYRPDRLARPRTKLPVRQLRKDAGWCDAVGHRLYNCGVSLPFAARHERLWRQDLAYDLLITLSHNQRPRIQGAGSAVFLHVWQNGAQGTEGCIALKVHHLRELLKECGRHTRLVI